MPDEFGKHGLRVMDSYSNRNEYRTLAGGDGLKRFRVTVGETDLFIACAKEYRKEALRAVNEIRETIEEHIKKEPLFLSSLRPIDINEDDPEVIRHMKEASFLSRVGPMASVAGMISEYTGRKLLEKTGRVIVENGGDIFLCSDEPMSVGIYAPGSSLSGKLCLKVDAKDGLGVCTSAGTYGHSLSFGKAQAAITVSKDTALSDAAATRLGNLLKDSGRIEASLNEIIEIPGITGAVAVIDDGIGFIGDIVLAAAGL